MQFIKGKAADDVLSFLGEGAEISGEISFSSTLRVNGVIKGKVRSESTLEVGPQGKVDAEVNVRRISVEGEFRGVIKASDRVEIRKDGKVYGDIYSPCLIIEAGAVFEGRCSMTNARKTADGEKSAPLKSVDSGTTPKLQSGFSKSI